MHYQDDDDGDGGEGGGGGDEASDDGINNNMHRDSQTKDKDHDDGADNKNVFFDAKWSSSSFSVAWRSCSTPL